MPTFSLLLPASFSLPHLHASYLPAPSLLSACLPINSILPKTYRCWRALRASFFTAPPHICQLYTTMRDRRPITFIAWHSLVQLFFAYRNAGGRNISGRKDGADHVATVPQDGNATTSPRPPRCTTIYYLLYITYVWYAMNWFSTCLRASLRAASLSPTLRKCYTRQQLFRYISAALLPSRSYNAPASPAIMPTSCLRATLCGKGPAAHRRLLAAGSTTALTVRLPASARRMRCWRVPSVVSACGGRLGGARAAPYAVIRFLNTGTVTALCVLGQYNISSSAAFLPRIAPSFAALALTPSFSHFGCSHIYGGKLSPDCAIIAHAMTYANLNCCYIIPLLTRRTLLSYAQHACIYTIPVLPYLNCASWRRARICHLARACLLGAHHLQRIPLLSLVALYIPSPTPVQHGNMQATRGARWLQAFSITSRACLPAAFSSQHSC